ncbi:MAG: DUF1566 domain-containing protein [Treponema sp.]|nr:DUF1566 domain-containing protein [Treponema sp.]MCL2252683.1 DUF1566 domain-containing protein [Treponema sp.]
MKKQVKIWRIIAITAIIGLAVVSCTDPNGNATHTHDWSGWTETIAATCLAKGVETRTCSGCGETETQDIDIDPDNHNLQAVDGEVEIEPTCTETGLGNMVCAREGCDYTENGVIPALGHLFTEWQETTPATCLDAAINTEKCSVCGTFGEETDVGHHALGHSAGEASGAIEATCFDDGFTGTGTCIRCSIELTGEVIPQLNHHYHDWTVPTCTTAGNSQRECSNDCGTISTRTEGFAALGHDHGTSGTGSLICKRENCDHQYAIGDTGPAGGIIFYVAPSGITIQGYGSSGDNGYFATYIAYYLEAAPANASGSAMRWASATSLLPNLSQNSSDTTDWAIGRGRMNTAIIIAARTFDTVANNAAKAAAAYSNGGKDDWFLPSREELNQMTIQRSHVGITSGRFWSSSQGSGLYAWGQFLNGSGVWDNCHKISDNNNVRAIRAF